MTKDHWVMGRTYGDYMSNPESFKKITEKEMWEYKKINHGFWAGMSQELNTYGKDGWEAYFHVQIDGGSVITFLKRRIK